MVPTPVWGSDDSGFGLDNRTPPLPAYLNGLAAFGFQLRVSNSVQLPDVAAADDRAVRFGRLRPRRIGVVALNQ